MAIAAVSKIMQSDPLVQLVQKEQHIGYVYYMDYDIARVITNDAWKERVHGIPLNAFLVAASFNPENYAAANEAEREVTLLRVIGSTKLPQDDDLIRAKIDGFQRREEVHSSSQMDDYDPFTWGEIQFGGFECKVLGTFYIKDHELYLGSDIENFDSASRLRVYRPRESALETIVNYVDPMRRQRAADEAKDLGISKPVAPFPVGTLRYTSTDRRHRMLANDYVEVRIQPSDFLARRTAVLGMTRTGKSNLIKQTIKVVKSIADESSIKIGQLIYDMNGEYANANGQDKGALSEIYPNDTVRYRTVSTPGFLDLRTNFYLELNEGLAMTCSPFMYQPEVESFRSYSRC